jgi:hypothetical protein
MQPFFPIHQARDFVFSDINITRKKEIYKEKLNYVTRNWVKEGSDEKYK